MLGGVAIFSTFNEQSESNPDCNFSLRLHTLLPGDHIYLSEIRIYLLTVQIVSRIIGVITKHCDKTRRCLQRHFQLAEILLGKTTTDLCVTGQLKLR